MKGLLFTYLLTYGGALASLINPYVGFLVYVCFAIIRPESLWYWSVPPGNYSRIIAIALLAGWALHGFGDWRLGKAKWILLALVGFWAWAGLSTLACPNTNVGLGFLETKGKIVLPCLVGLTLIDSTSKLKQLAWVIALSQGYVAFDLNLSYFDGFNRLQRLGFGGMDNNSQAISMVTGVGLAFFLGLRERRWWLKLVAFACAAFMVHAVMFSFSRGGQLGLCFVGIATFFLLPKRPIYLGLYALGVVAALWMAGPEVVERFLTSFADEESRDASAESRVVMWKGCVDMMLQNPILGVGPDHFPFRVTELGFARGKEAHTLWLQIGAELGFPGLLFLVAYYGLTIWWLYAISKKKQSEGNEDAFELHAAEMVIASLAGFVIAAQFVSLEGLELPYYITMLGAGAIKLDSTREYVEDVAVANWDTIPAWMAYPQMDYGWDRARK